MANGRTSESNPLKSIEFLVNNDAGWHVLFKLDINNILNAPTNTAHYQDLFYALVVIFQKLQKQFTTLQPALKRELQNQAHRQSFQVQKQEGEDQQILEQYVMSVREILFTLMQKLDPTHNAPQLNKTCQCIAVLAIQVTENIWPASVMDIFNGFQSMMRQEENQPGKTNSISKLAPMFQIFSSLIEECEASSETRVKRLTTKEHMMKQLYDIKPKVLDLAQEIILNHCSFVPQQETVVKKRFTKHVLEFLRISVEDSFIDVSQDLFSIHEEAQQPTTKTGFLSRVVLLGRNFEKDPTFALANEALELLLCCVEQLSATWDPATSTSHTQQVIIKSSSNAKGKKKQKKKKKRRKKTGKDFNPNVKINGSQQKQQNRRLASSLISLVEPLWTAFHPQPSEEEVNNLPLVAELLSEVLRFCAPYLLCSDSKDNPLQQADFNLLERSMPLLQHQHAEVVLAFVKFWCAFALVCKPVIYVTQSTATATTSFQMNTTHTVQKLAVFKSVIENLISVSALPQCGHQFFEDKDQEEMFVQFREDLRAAFRHICLHAVGIGNLLSLIKDGFDAIANKPVIAVGPSESATLWRQYESLIHCFSAFGKVVKNHKQQNRSLVSSVAAMLLTFQTAVQHQLYGSAHAPVYCAMINCFGVFGEVVFDRELPLTLHKGMERVENSLLYAWLNFTLIGLMFPEHSDAFDFVAKQDHSSAISLLKVLPLVENKLVAALSSQGISLQQFLTLLVHCTVLNPNISQKSRLAIMESIVRLSTFDKQIIYEFFLMLLKMILSAMRAPHSEPQEIRMPDPDTCLQKVLQLGVDSLQSTELISDWFRVYHQPGFIQTLNEPDGLNLLKAVLKSYQHKKTSKAISYMHPFVRFVVEEKNNLGVFQESHPLLCLRLIKWLFKYVSLQQLTCEDSGQLVKTYFQVLLNIMDSMSKHERLTNGRLVAAHIGCQLDCLKLLKTVPDADIQHTVGAFIQKQLFSEMPRLLQVLEMIQQDATNLTQSYVLLQTDVLTKLLMCINVSLLEPICSDQHWNMVGQVHIAIVALSSRRDSAGNKQVLSCSFKFIELLVHRMQTSDFPGKASSGPNSLSNMLSRIVKGIIHAFRQTLPSHMLDECSKAVFHVLELSPGLSLQVFTGALDEANKPGKQFLATLQQYNYQVTFKKFRALFKTLCGGKKKGEASTV